MNLRPLLARPAARLLLAGALVGLVVLGVGGRVAMAFVQAASNTTPPRFTLGGTVTVIALGAASGFAGAAIALAIRALARPLGIKAVWQMAVFAAALALVTQRGLHGTAPVGRWYFYPLVAIYGALTIWLDRRMMVMSSPSAR